VLLLAGLAHSRKDCREPACVSDGHIAASSLSVQSSPSHLGVESEDAVCVLREPCCVALNLEELYPALSSEITVAEAGQDTPSVYAWNAFREDKTITSVKYDSKKGFYAVAA
jgi:hypothetical protein